MKKLFNLLFILILSLNTFAQTNAFNYQAVLRNEQGQILANKQVTVKLTIRKGSSNGTTVHTQTYTGLTNDLGLINIVVTPTTWTADKHFIEVIVNNELLGVTEILAVPFANFATYAETADYNKLTNKPDLTNFATTNKVTELENIVNNIPSNLPNQTDINNWNTAFSWGNHQGLYMNKNYIPQWTEIQGKPTLFNGDYNNLTNQPTLFNGDYNNLTNQPILFNGDYNSLTNKPNLTIYATKTQLTTLETKVTALETKVTALETKVTTLETTVNTQATKITALEDQTAHLQYLLTEVMAHVGYVYDPTIVKDIEGNSYGSIAIGDRIWLASNLRTKKYNDGTSIPLINSSVEYAGYSIYKRNNTSNLTASEIEKYGLLYNGYVVDTEKICPSGWRVPTEEDWQSVTNPNIDLALEYSGYRHYSTYEDLNVISYYWSSTIKEIINNTEGLVVLKVFSSLDGTIKYNKYYSTIKLDGYPIRCVKDINN
jgi:uncharacterized coiled-coil protein SlyX